MVIVNTDSAAHADPGVGKCPRAPVILHIYSHEIDQEGMPYVIGGTKRPSRDTAPHGEPPETRPD